MPEVNKLFTELARMTCGRLSMRYKNVQDEEICHCKKVAFDSRFQSPPIVPCCDPCPHCGQNIKKNWLVSHATRCLKKKLKSEQETRGHVCTCACHSSDGDIYMHAGEGPCCEQCPYCMKNIVRHQFQVHTKECIIKHSESLSAVIDRKELGQH